MSENITYNLNDFDFDLPEDLIAQYPAENRDDSRLFILDRKTESFMHEHFYNLPLFIDSDSVLVFNNARVIPARIMFRRETGAVVEAVLVRKINEMSWLILTNRMKKIRPGEFLHAVEDDTVFVRIIKRSGDFFETETSVPFTNDILSAIGNMPLPSYIHRNAKKLDETRYQTVYAAAGNAVAAPTAGLHFTDDLFDKLAEKNIDTIFTTLDVSWGTFSPVRTENIGEHKMHSESFELTDTAAAKINDARSAGKKIIAVGTTSLRVLESSFKDGMNIPGRGETDIFIYPPYQIKSINSIITNFHTPKSTLLMLVSAFAGHDLIMNAYNEAVREKYRFFSYGDSMFIK
ncbi:MAG: tRNA preQ1(34) S-adenosylmethionine ribosyltransferase-isomerase QueA [Spirochaetes bacterium]|nr:tRNA preQ1(34) S-adenosylmethionine ribosyltransferase-isomerase QueA [Spirochaetota bacterium]